MAIRLYKLLIIGTVILLVLGGVWFWHSTKVSESPLSPKNNPAVKTTYSEPINKSIVKSKSKTEDTIELKKFSDEEIEVILEWLDSLSESEKSLEPASSESEKLAEEIAGEQDDSEKEEDDAKLKEELLKADAEEVWEELEPKVYEYGDIRREEERALSIVRAKYGDVVPATPDGIYLSNRYLELKRARRKMFPDVYILAIKYANLTGQHEALVSGWLHQFLRENRVVK